MNFSELVHLYMNLLGFVNTAAQLGLILDEGITPFVSHAPASVRKHPKLDYLFSVPTVIYFFFLANWFLIAL